MTTALSIIIPSLNEAAGIAATLEALQGFRARGAEIIVADGGSSDASVKLAVPFADAVVAAPRGRAAQMNAGARTARGDVLLFMHADCVLPPDADRLIVDKLAASRKQWGRFDVALDGRHALLKIIAFMMNTRSRLTGIATGDQAIFMTRELFSRLNGFPALPLMEDIALSKNAKRVGAPLCLRARVITSARRWERNGVLRTVLRMWRLRLAYYFGADPAALALRYDAVRARD
ncbi:MAG: glycosyl transferase [Betaproteobacteria bacterium]|nr:glycosyl transferase [Betaproteobacteria bacterium]